MIFFVIAFVLTATSVGLYVATPLYMSQMIILFEGRQHMVEANIDTALDGRPQDDQTIKGEMKILTSRDLAGRIVDQLGLLEDPELSGQKKSYLVRSMERIFADPRASSRSEVIDHFLDRLSVTQVRESRAVVVGFTSASPERAAAILKALAEAYFVARLEDRMKTTEWIGKWLTDKSQELRAHVESAEHEIAIYREKYDLVSGSRGALLNEQISKLSVESADASGARQAAEAKLQYAEKVLANPKQPDEVTRIVDSAVIQGFRGREADLQRRAAELEQMLGPRHPELIQIRAQQEEMRRAMQGEINQVLKSLRYNVQVEKAREDALRRDLQEAKTVVAKADSHSVGLRDLERNAEVSRIMLERFLSLIVQIGVQRDVQAFLPHAHIIDEPFIPEEPSSPRVIPTLVVAFLASAGLGILLAFGADYLDTLSFVSAVEIEETTGVPVLAHIPATRTKSRDSDVSMLALKNPGSTFAESIGSLYTHTMMFNTNSNDSENLNHIKVMLFTSCQANEGKSTIALAMARQQAAHDRRVLFLDTDFRLSRMHRLTGVKAAPGLAEVLSGELSAEGVIQRDMLSRAHIISAGKSPVEHFNLVQSQQIKLLLESLRAQYDLIVIDTMPILALAHAYPFAECADASMLVVRWRRTRRKAVVYALRQMQKLGCRAYGVVLSMVDMKGSQIYAYGDLQYYYGGAKRYHNA